MAKKNSVYDNWASGIKSDYGVTKKAAEERREENAKKSSGNAALDNWLGGIQRDYGSSFTQRQQNLINRKSAAASALNTIGQSTNAFYERTNGLIDRYNSTVNEYRNEHDTKKWLRDLEAGRDEIAGIRKTYSDYSTRYREDISDILAQLDSIEAQYNDMISGVTESGSVYNSYAPKVVDGVTYSAAELYGFDRDTYGKNRAQTNELIKNLEVSGIRGLDFDNPDDWSAISQEEARLARERDNAQFAYQDALSFARGDENDEEVVRLKADADAAQSAYDAFMANPTTGGGNQKEIDWIRENYLPMADYYANVNKYGSLDSVKSYDILDRLAKTQNEDERAYLNNYIDMTVQQSGMIGRDNYESVAESQRAFDAIKSGKVRDFVEEAAIYYSNAGTYGLDQYQRALDEGVKATGLTREELDRLVKDSASYIAQKQNDSRNELIASGAKGWGGVGGTLASYLVNPAANIEADTYLLLSQITGQTPEIANEAMRNYQFVQGTRGAVAENIEKATKIKIGDTNVASWLYQAINSTVDSGINMLITSGISSAAGLAPLSVGDKLIRATVSNAVMGSGAAVDAFIEAKQQGISDKQALWKSISAGFVEGLTEAIGGDEIAKAVIKGEGAITAMLKSAFAEGTEEWMSNELNRAIGDAFFEEDNVTVLRNIIRLAAGYKAAGYDSREAANKAFKDAMTEDASSFLAGAFSGLMMGSTGTLSQNISTGHAAISAYGGRARAIENINTQIEDANALNPAEPINIIKSNASAARIGSAIRAAQQSRTYSDVRDAMKEISPVIREELAKRGLTGSALDDATAAITKSSVKDMVREGASERAEKLLELTAGQKEALRWKSMRGVYTSVVADLSETINVVKFDSVVRSRAGSAEGRIREGQDASQYVKDKTKVLEYAYDFGDTAKGLEYAIEHKGSLTTEQAKALFEDRVKTIKPSVDEKGDIIVSNKVRSKEATDKIREIYASLGTDEAEMFAAKADRAWEVGNLYDKTQYGADWLGIMSETMPEVYDNLKTIYDMGASTVRQTTAKVSGGARNISEDELSAARERRDIVYAVDEANMKPEERRRFRSSKRFHEAFGRIIGVNFVFFDSRADGKAKGNSNGWYDPTTNSIYLDLNAGLDNGGSLLFTTAHELVHYMRYNANAEYKALQQFIVDKFYNGKQSDFDNGVLALVAGQSKLSNDPDAVEELVARSCENMLKNSKAISELIEENTGLARTMNKHLRWFAEKFHEIVSRFTGESYSRDAFAKSLLKADEDMAELQKRFDAGIKALANRKSAPGTMNMQDIADTIVGKIENRDVRRSVKQTGFSGANTSNNDIADESSVEYNALVKAEENFGRLMESIENDNSILNKQGRNFSRGETERLKEIFGAGEITGQQDKALYRDAIRRAGGSYRREINEGGETLNAEVVREEFYTYEMLQIASRNRMHGINTVFFLDDITYANDGSSRGVEGLADADNGTLYVKVNAKNARDLNVEENSFKKISHAVYYGTKSASRLAKHERLHIIRNSNSVAKKAADRLVDFVDNAKGKYVKEFDQINYWYQRHLEQYGYGFSDYSEEIAADIYAGMIALNNPAMMREATALADDIEKAIDGNVFDSEGAELTEQQVEYFKDSKVRDENGNLLVVYHGSPSKFTVFSANFINAHGNAHGRGFYFTENRAYAEGYEKDGGQLLSGYLNITKPMSESSVTMTRANVMTLLKAVDPTGDDIAINYDRSGGRGYPSAVWKSRAYNDTVNALMTNENDVDIVAELTNAGGDAETVLSAARSILGYDGVIYTNEYGEHEFVAFESNQFKNADNLAPTENQDIRYSIKTLADGKQYVQADRQVIFGSDPDSWSEQLEEYINGKIRKGQNVQLIGADGDILTLTARTAGKVSSRYNNDGTTMSDEAFARKVSAGSHIDELAQVSVAQKRGTVADQDSRHGDDAIGGWKYRNAYFRDFDGKYYLCSISVQIGKDGNAVYNIGKMQERAFPTIGGSSAEGGAQRREESSSKESITEPKKSVKFSEANVSNNLPEINRLYMEAVNSGDMETVQQMVNERAEFLRAETFAQTDVPTYRIRRDAPPKKTIKVYKTFTMSKNGNPSALFVSSQYDLPVGVWLDAQDTYHFTDQKNGHMYVPSTKNPNTQGGATGRPTLLSNISEEDLAELEKRGYIKRGKDGNYTAKSITSLAYRPGWHAGDLPFFPQGGMKIEGSNYENVHRYNQVVYECEMAADVDYTTYTVDADGNVKYRDRQEMPKNGSYKFATNPMANAQDIGAWFISGSLKIVRALTQEECDRILAENGRAPQEWQAYQDSKEFSKAKKSGMGYEYEHTMGALDLDALGYDPNRTDGGRKLLDPITYDDDGNIIPLSERFNKQVNDVRYSRKYDADGLTGSEIQNADSIISRLKTTMIGSQYEDDLIGLSAERMRSVITDSAYKGEPDTAKSYIAWIDPTDFIYATTTSTAKRMDIKAEAGELDMAKLRGESQPIYLRVNMETGEIIGHEGRHRLTALMNAGAQKVAVIIKSDKAIKNAQPIRMMKLKGQTFDERKGTDFYVHSMMPLSERYADTAAELFGKAKVSYSLKQASDREILSDALMDAAQTDEERTMLTNYQKSIREYEAKEAQLVKIASEIRELSFAPGARDTERIKSLQLEANKLRRSINNYDKGLLKLEAAEPLKRVLEREKAAAERRAVERGRDRLREYRINRDQSEAVTKYRKRIEDKVKKLSDELLINSDKKHVPEPLKKPLNEFLQSINFDSKRLTSGGAETQKDIRFRERAQALALALQSYDGSDGYVDLPADQIEFITEQLNAVTRAIDSYDGDGSIYLMDAAQLKRLDNALGVISKAVSTVNEFMANRRYAEVATATQETMNDLDSLGQSKTMGKVLGLLKKLGAWDNATPFYAFRRMGNAASEMFHSIQDGWDKMALNSQRVIAFAKEAYTAAQQREWSEEVLDIELSEKNGEARTVRMTVAQAMSLYCLAKRQQAVGHLLGGGIRVGDFEDGRTTVKQTDPYTLLMDDVQNIIAQLSDEQRRVADSLQNYMNTVGSDWGNEVSMARFGYKAFGEANYFPITSDPTNLSGVSPESRENDMFRLLNMSSTKSLIKGANNALMLFDIFDVFSNHMSDMAKYNALALPILDMVKWYNYKEKITNPDGTIDTKTLQRSLEKAFGTNENGAGYATTYLKNFIRDLNGASNTGREVTGLSAFMGRYKKAAVAANLRVAVQQPMSIMRAQAVIDPKWIAKGYLNIREGREEMLKYSGIAVWKDLGFYDTNIGRDIAEQIKHDDNFLTKVDDASMKLAEYLDSVTWGVLWSAAKAEQASKGLTGQELIAATNERFRDIIYASQVVDSTVTRSDIMRSSSQLAKIYTSFMSEPTLTWNMMLDVYMDAHYAQRRGESVRGITGKALRTGFALVTNAAAIAIVTALMDAWRDDDSYETFWEKFTEKAPENFLDELNPVDKIAVLNTVWDVLANDYTSDTVDKAWLTDIKKTIDIAIEDVKLWTNPDYKPTDVTYNGKMTVYGQVYQLLKTASDISGIPMGSVAREFTSAWNNIIAPFIGEKARIKTYDESPNTVGFPNLVEAIIDGDESRQMKIESAMAVNGISDKKIADGIKAALKTFYLDGEIDEDELADILCANCGYETTGTGDESINYLIDGWNYGSGYKLATNLEAAFADGDKGEIKNAVEFMRTRYSYDDSGIKRAITDYWKQTYRDANEAERKRIRELILATGLYDAKTLDKKLNEWVYAE